MKATAANLTNPIANLRHCSENARAPMQTPKMQDRKATVSISNPMAPQGHPAGAEMKYRTSLMRSGTHQGTINLTPKSSRAIRVFGSLQEMNVIALEGSQQHGEEGNEEEEENATRCPGDQTNKQTPLFDIFPHTTIAAPPNSAALASLMFFLNSKESSVRWL